MMRSFRSIKRIVAIPLLFAVGFASIGALFLIFSRAAPPSVSVEAESGRVLGTVALTTDTDANGNAAIVFTGTPPPSTSKKLILFQQQRIPADYISSHVAEVDALPFEGVIFRLPSMDSMRPGNIISVEQFKSELAGMQIAQTQLTKVRENFVTVRLMKPSPFDAYTSVMATNLGNLAEAARDAGLAGIVYDNEDYADDVWAPEDSCPGKTLAECQVLARESGKTVMKAMIARWPTIKFMTTLGPFFGHQPSMRAILNIIPEPKHYILGAYTVGLNEATIGTAATYIDGGEVYSTSTKAKADLNYATRKTTMPQQSDLVVAAIKTAWSSKISLAFAIYDKAYLGTPAQWTNDLSVNIPAADTYTWTWSEKFAWVGAPEGGRVAVPQEWIDATKAGRTAAGLPAMPR